MIVTMPSILRASPVVGMMGVKGELVVLTCFDVGKRGRGKVFAVIRAVVKNVRVAMMDRDESRENPQRK